MHSIHSMRQHAAAAGRCWPHPTGPTAAGDPATGLLHGALLGAGEAVTFALRAERKYWLHVAQGSVEIDGQALAAGDALGIEQQAGTLNVVGAGDGVADVLLFDLPA